MANIFYPDKYKTLQELAMAAGIHGPSDNVKFVIKFAHNPSLAADVEEDIWATGGTRTLVTYAEKVNIASASAADDSGGTGANLIQLDGVDSNEEFVTELVTMDGTTPVQSSTTFKHVHRVLVAYSGSGRVNAGDITLTGATSGATRVVVPSGGGITQMSHYYIPDGWNAYLLSQTATVQRSSGTGSRDGELTQRFHIFDSNTTLRTLKYGISSAAEFHTMSTIPSKINGPILMRYSFTPQNNNTAVSLSYSLLLIRTTYANV